MVYNHISGVIFTSLRSNAHMLIVYLEDENNDLIHSRHSHQKAK